MLLHLRNSCAFLFFSNLFQALDKPSFECNINSAHCFDKFLIIRYVCLDYLFPPIKPLAHVPRIRICLILDVHYCLYVLHITSEIAIIPNEREHLLNTFGIWPVFCKFIVLEQPTSILFIICIQVAAMFPGRTIYFIFVFFYKKF